MQRRAQMIVTAVFLAVLFVPMVLFLVGVRPEAIENRAITEYPEVDAKSLLDEDTYARISAYLTDRLPYRDVAIRTEADIEDATTISEPIREGIPRGTDGWLYHPDTLVADCIGPPPSDFLEAGDEVAQQAADAGIPYLYLVAPEKVTVYPDHLPSEGLAGLLGLSDDEPPACNHLWDVDLAEGAPTRPWLEPLADDLLSAVSSSDEQLYYKHDTHWTDAGARHEVQEVVDFIDPTLWDPMSYVPSPARVKRPGDLARMRGMTDDEETVPGYSIVRPGVTVETFPGPIERPETMHDISRATTTAAPLVPGTTVLVGDSFARHSLHLLQPYFEELILIDREYLADHGIEEVVEGRPTAIIVEQVQRNMTKGWWVDYLDGVSDYVDGLEP
jgi:hypothetical protein